MILIHTFCSATVACKEPDSHQLLCAFYFPVIGSITTFNTFAFLLYYLLFHFPFRQKYVFSTFQHSFRSLVKIYKLFLVILWPFSLLV